MRSRVGSIRSLHGPTRGRLRRVWAAQNPAGSLGGRVSCPLSSRHVSRKSPAREAVVLACLNL
ncbi:hypothetical protein CP978_11970 [Streptomyces nodosus]|uniref:Uncharacterized protein n=1 Tax=Streptomyces nodosus TaxID=40318 RepID=A0A5P2WFQ4_9ACTN|nr:hypothetical protein CP978_11970 [Streptomyces nodosus]